MKKNYILTAIGIYVLIIVSIFSMYLYHSLNLYENNILLIGITLVSIIMICTIFYFSRNATIYNIGTFLMLLTNVVLIYNIISIDNLNGYVTNMFTKKYDYTTYNVYVQRKNTIYNNVYKLENKNIGILNDNENNVSKYLNNLMDVNIITYDDVNSISIAIESGEIQGFVLTEEQYEKTDFDIKYKVKTIYHGKIKETV